MERASEHNWKEGVWGIINENLARKRHMMGFGVAFRDGKRSNSGIREVDLT